jgi:hypothetical protein
MMGLCTLDVSKVYILGAIYNSKNLKLGHLL